MALQRQGGQEDTISTTSLVESKLPPGGPTSAQSGGPHNKKIYVSPGVMKQGVH